MKKYLTIILATLFTMSVFIGVCKAKQFAGTKQRIDHQFPYHYFGTGEMPDNSFSKEEYQKLLALQLDGYEDMTVSDYRNHIAKLTDTAEYRDLLERFWKSQILYGVKRYRRNSFILVFMCCHLQEMNGNAKFQ